MHLLNTFGKRLQNASAFKQSIALALMAAIIFMPGLFTLPPVDRDETRFAQASRQMVQSGDFVDIQFMDEKRYKKPIGIYWAQAASVLALGADLNAPIWVYRLPSYLAAIASVLLIVWVTNAFLPRHLVFMCGIMMASIVLLHVEARLAKTDAFLLMLTLVAQGALARVWLDTTESKRQMAFLFWGAMGAGILVKGPIVPMISGLTLVGLLIHDRSLNLISRLKPVPGLIITLAISLPWYVAIGIVSDNAFYVEAILRDFLNKATNVAELHGAPPGAYLIALIGTFWPGTVFLAAAVPGAYRNWRNPIVVFALCWALPSWIVFELAATKLPHYVLPLYPALILLTIFGLSKLRENFLPYWATLVSWLLVIVPMSLMLASAVLLVFFADTNPLMALIFGLASIAVAVTARRLFQKTENLPSALTAALCSAALIYTAVFAYTFPKLTPLWISNHIVAAAFKQADCEQVDLLAVDYREPSLVFLWPSPSKVRFGSQDAIVPHLLSSSKNCSFALFSDQVLNSIADQIHEKSNNSNHIVHIATIEGYKLNGGDFVTFHLYRGA